MGGNVLLLAVVLGCAGCARQQAVDDSPEAQAAAAAVQWLAAQQQADGSFASFDPVATTMDAVMAGVSAGVDVSTWVSAEEATPMDYLATQIEVCLADPGKAGKLLSAVVAAGQDVHAFGGQDLLAAVQAMGGDSGAFGATAPQQAWAILGLLAAGSELPEGALDQLRAMQQADGGWDSGWGEDADTTALALQALLAANVSAKDDAVVKGLAYLRMKQAPTGGFVSYSEESNPNTTAYVLQALLAANEDLAGCQQNGVGPLDDLLTFKLESGAFEFTHGGGGGSVRYGAKCAGAGGATVPRALAVRDRVRLRRSAPRGPAGALLLGDELTGERAGLI